MTTPLHRNTYEQGREDGKAESAETIRKLREALDKALAENLAMRPTKGETRVTQSVRSC